MASVGETAHTPDTQKLCSPDSDVVRGRRSLLLLAQNKVRGWRAVQEVGEEG